MTTSIVQSGRHKWGNPVMLASMCSPDGNERNVRICSQCHMQKITVIPRSGHPWREWKTKDGMKATLDHTPPCTATVTES